MSYNETRERQGSKQRAIAIEIIDMHVRAYQESIFLATGSLPTTIAFCEACIEMLCPPPSLFAHNEYAGMEVQRRVTMQECVVHGGQHADKCHTVTVNVQGQLPAGVTTEQISKAALAYIERRQQLGQQYRHRERLI